MKKLKNKVADLCHSEGGTTEESPFLTCLGMGSFALLRMTNNIDTTSLLYLFRIIILILFLSTASSATATTVEKVVATVDGTAITSFELDEGLKTYGPNIQKTTGATGTELKAKVLDKLIDDKVLENEMKKEETSGKIVVEPHEVDSFIDRVCRSSRITTKQFEEELRKKGYTIEQYRHELSGNMLKNKFISSNISRKISISERELKDHFSRHMDEFKSTSSVQLAQILIPFTASTNPDDLEKIEKVAFDIAEAAKNTSNFEALAKSFSGKPFPVQGGDLGIVKIADLQPQIAQMAAALDIGQIGSPVITQTGVHIIKVLNRAKTSPKDFSSVRDQVNDAVYEIKMKGAVEGYVKQLRRNAQIEIKGLGAN